MTRMTSSASLVVMALALAFIAASGCVDSRIGLPCDSDSECDDDDLACVDDVCVARGDGDEGEGEGEGEGDEGEGEGDEGEGEGEGEGELPICTDCGTWEELAPLDADLELAGAGMFASGVVVVVANRCAGADCHAILFFIREDGTASADFSLVPDGKTEFAWQLAPLVLRLDDDEFAIGGGAGPAQPIEDVFTPDATPMFRVSETNLEQLPDPPVPRVAAAFLINELPDVYLFGGTRSIFADQAQVDSFVLDPGDTAWSPLAAMPGSRAAHNAFFLDDGRIWLTGGYEGGGGGTTDTFIFDPVSGEYDPGEPGIFGDGTIVRMPNGDAWEFGFGVSHFDGTVADAERVFIDDPTGLDEIAVGLVDDTQLLVMGQAQSGSAPGQPLLFDTTTAALQPIEAPPDPIAGALIAGGNGTAVVLGGTDEFGNPTRAVWRFTLTP